MSPMPLRGALVLVLFVLVSLANPAAADEQTAVKVETTNSLRLDTAPIEKIANNAADAVDDVISGALDLLGIRYKRGGRSPETGFDCSGFVEHVFQKTMGLVLPHSAREMAKNLEKVRRDDLRPGDLVFFNTMRRTFSHVGIYLGEHLFVHAPKPGAQVRVEDMRQSYWARRFTGARRIEKKAAD